MPRHRARPPADDRLGARSSILYDALLVAQPSPVIALNRAIAVGFRDGYDAGLAELRRLAEALDGYHLLPAAARPTSSAASAATPRPGHAPTRPPSASSARRAPSVAPLRRRIAELSDSSSPSGASGPRVPHG